MKAYQTRNAAALRKRVRKAHSKAKFAGVLYLLGSLALLALACMPMLAIGDTQLWVGTFLQAFKGGDNRDLIAIITSVFYILLLITCLFNFLSCLGRLRSLRRKGTRYVNGYNKNMKAMEHMAKRFSGSFANIINIYLIIYIMQPTTVEKALTPLAYVALAVGLFVHFLAGLVSGKVSFFNVGGERQIVTEEKRENSLFVYFFRNLVQVAATAVIIYYFLSACVLGDVLQSRSFTSIQVVLQALVLVWLFVLVKHATANTEFNRFGMNYTGMRTYRIFSLFTFLTAGGMFVLENGNDGAQNYLIIAIVALVAFLVDCICKTRSQASDEDVQPMYMGQQPVSPLSYQQAPTGFVQPIVYQQKVPVQQPTIVQPVVYQQKAPSIVQPIVYQQKTPGVVQPIVYQQNTSGVVQPVVHQQPGVVQPVVYQQKVPVQQAMGIVQPVVQQQKVPVQQATNIIQPIVYQQKVPVQQTTNIIQPVVCQQNAHTQQPTSIVQPILQQQKVPVQQTTSTPVYYPYPVPQPVPVYQQVPVPSAPAQYPGMPMAGKPVASPAPERLKPTPSPATLAMESASVAYASSEIMGDGVNAEETETKKNKKLTKKQAKKQKKLAKKDKKLAKKKAKKEKELAKKNAKKAKTAKVLGAAASATIGAGVAEKATQKTETPDMKVNEEPVEIKTPLDPNKQWKVRCPKCGKELMVRETSPYHRCPACDKVFSLRKFEAYVKK